MTEVIISRRWVGDVARRAFKSYFAPLVWFWRGFK